MYYGWNSDLYDHYLLMDYQLRANRAEARERLTLEEQAAYGLLDTLPERTSRRVLHELWASACLLGQALKQACHRAAAARALLFGKT